MFGKLRRPVALTVSILLLAILFAGCSSGKYDIVIGVLVPTSGDDADTGKDMMQAYQLAVSEINKAGGVLGRNLRLFQADDGSEAGMASVAASKIITEGVDFVVGGYNSGATLITLQQFSDANLLMLITAANGADITRQGFNRAFMVNSPATHIVLTLIDLLNFTGAHNIAIIHRGSSYSQNLSDLCEAGLPGAGFNIAAIETLNGNAANISNAVASVLSTDIDFVFWCGDYEDGADVIRTLRHSGYEGHVGVSDASATPALIEAAGFEGDRVFIISPPHAAYIHGAEAFVLAYRAFHKMNPDDETFPGAYALLAYDTIYLLKTAIERVGTTETEAVRNAMQNIEFQGLSGIFKFTPDRERTQSSFILMQIDYDEFIRVIP